MSQPVSAPVGAALIHFKCSGASLSIEEIVIGENKGLTDGQRDG